MECKVCGNVLGDKVVFCPNCGAKTERGEETPFLSEDTANLIKVAEALLEAEKETEDVPDELIKTEDEKLEDIMDAADKLVEADDPGREALSEAERALTTEGVNDAAKEPEYAEDEVLPEELATEDFREMPYMTLEAQEVHKESVAGILNKQPVTKENRRKKKEQLRAEKAAAKIKYVIAGNPISVTVFNILLAIVFTGVLFVAAGIFMLAHPNFDEFYTKVIFADLLANIDFWVLTSSWYAMAVYSVLALFVLLMFFVLKRRKYAILNYVGIPAIINGLLFLAIGSFSYWFSDAFSFKGIMAELFDIVGGAANEQIMWSAVFILGFGVAAVLLYAVISAVHKAVYRRRCRKAENV